MTRVSADLKSIARALPVATSPKPGNDAMAGCPVHELRAKLRRSGLRPTRQRVALGWLLFAKGDRHITAEMLYEEATKAKVPVSLSFIAPLSYSLREKVPFAKFKV